MKTRSCRTCVHLDVPLSATGRRVPRINNAYRCLADIPPAPAFPMSVTKNFGYRWFSEFSKRHMEPSEGTVCPTWESL